MRYSLLIFFLYPLFFIYTLKITIKFKSLKYFKQRLGIAYPEFNQQPIWIHCASVGEVNTFIPLLEHLIKRLPEQSFLITTNTITGAATLKRHKLTNTQHCYLPIENNRTIKRFLKKTRPKLALIMETEIWPLLFKNIHKTNIPLSIINARLSEKTINTNNWAQGMYCHTLKYVDTVFARSEQDARAFEKLADSTLNIKIIGNLKFSSPAHSTSIGLKNFTDREYILAASTHRDEETQLAALWKHSPLNKILLVIVPRHPDRGDAIYKQLSSLQLNVSARSKGDAVTINTNIYLADTLGELSSFMKNATMVFMGGSLIPHGGQNFLEAARLGKAIITGPHMHNFQNEIDLFKQQHACIQINTITELSTVIQSLLIDSNNRTSLEHCASKIMKDQAKIAEIYLQELEKQYASIFM